MKISFLVTYYNQAEYVRQSLDSILAIDKPCDWEILVGDDGSGDETVAIVQEYIKKYPDYIRLFIMPREQGVTYYSVLRASANRLNLLEHSSGDYFCTLDGDDFYCDTGFIQTALEILEHHNDIAVVAFNYVMNYPDGRMEIAANMKNVAGILDVKRYLIRYYTHAGACIHRVNKSNLKLLKDVQYFDDNDIVINSLSFGKLFYSNTPIYAYRQTGASLWTSMESAEQHILNALGYDEEMLIAAPHVKKYLYIRYRSALFFVWKNKRKMRGLLGEKKYMQYTMLLKDIEHSLTYRLLYFDTLPYIEKVKLIFLFEGSIFIYRIRSVLSKIKRTLYDFRKKRSL